MTQEGWTALMLACKAGHTALVQALVQADTDLNAVNKVVNEREKCQFQQSHFLVGSLFVVEGNYRAHVRG
jgi:ankyrin repeat protein